MRVGPYYDSLLGKLVAHAATREAAIEQLAGALDRLQLLGLPTNRRVLAACLRHPTFGAGVASIAFLARQGDELRREIEQEEEALATDGGLAALYGASAVSGSTLACAFERPLRLRHRGQVIAVSVRERPGGTLEMRLGGETRIVAPSPAITCVRLDESSWHVQCGTVDLVIEDASYEPGGSAQGGAAAHELRAPFNGKVIAVQASPGAVVARGDTLLVLESMKLEHALAAARDGIVKSVHVTPGQQAATMQVLVTFEAAP
jgi:3-methylcrotonyl-CoA carboxylase alpha subunit/geranyl-CoA carboxylase alpha subunit